LVKYRELGGRGGEITLTETTQLRWQGIRNRADLLNVSGDGDLTFELGFRTGDAALDGVYVDAELVDASGKRATHSKTRFLRKGFRLLPDSLITFRYTIHAPMLAPGHYYLIVYAYNSAGVLAWVEHIDACTISAKSYFPAVEFIDDIKAATVPRFEIELL
jgi:hypothetical protein